MNYKEFGIEKNKSFASKLSKTTASQDTMLGQEARPELTFARRPGSETVYEPIETILSIAMLAINK
ncbi:hypothetical protein PtB15_7B585 [Puccinia triticina]|nr:hypothetical protein PtB15_7B585 [Puccinia triticina]